MLPCQPTCAAYQDGCHKTCPHWKHLQERQRLLREAKKRYLRYHVERCTQTVRQLRSLQVRHGAW